MIVNYYLKDVKLNKIKITFLRLETFITYNFCNFSNFTTIKLLSYIQNSPENIAFELKYINSIKAIKNHISGHALASKKQNKLDRWFTAK